jgi:hypothetical protein
MTTALNAKMPAPVHAAGGQPIRRGRAHTGGDDPRERAVSDQQTDGYPSRQSGPDLEYDLAHEETSRSGNTGPEPVQQRISVATGTPDDDGDLSYDLAHDVPSR